LLNPPTALVAGNRGAFLIAGVVLHIGIFSSSRSWDGSNRFLIRAAHPAGLMSILVDQCD
jgi:hypothetical protein